MRRFAEKALTKNAHALHGLRASLNLIIVVYALFPIEAQRDKSCGKLEPWPSLKPDAKLEILADAMKSEAPLLAEQSRRTHSSQLACATSVPSAAIDLAFTQPRELHSRRTFSLRARWTDGAMRLAFTRKPYLAVIDSLLRRYLPLVDCTFTGKREMPRALQVAKAFQQLIGIYG